MKLSTIRTIDYWAGIPICFGLDILSAFISPFKPRKKNPKAILIIELSEAGSLIIGYSAIKRLRDKLPEAELYFMVFERHANGLKLLNIIPEENIITIRDSSFSDFVSDTVAAVLRMWRIGIDSVIDLELFSRATSVFSFLALANNRVGFYGYTGEGLYRGRFIHNFKVMYNPYKHMALNFLALVESLLNQDERGGRPMLKAKIPEELITPLKLPKTDDAVSNGREMIKQKFPQLAEHHKIMIVNPNAGDLPIRAWELDKFIEATRQLLAKNENMVAVILGLPSAGEDAEKMVQKIDSDRLLNLVGITKGFADIVDLCHVSDVLLTNDSGPAQYASLTDVNVVVIFGPETPLLYRPLGQNIFPVYSGFSCSPCLTAANHRNTVCSNNLCIQSIPVAEVVDICTPLLM